MASRPKLWCYVLIGGSLLASCSCVSSHNEYCLSEEASRVLALFPDDLPSLGFVPLVCNQEEPGTSSNEVSQSHVRAWVCKMPITRAMFYRLAGVEVSIAPQEPIDGLPWVEAMRFCAEATSVARKNGGLDSDEVIRLPAKSEMDAMLRCQYHILYSSSRSDSKEWCFDVFRKHGVPWAWLLDAGNSEHVKSGTRKRLLCSPCHHGVMGAEFRPVIAVRRPEDDISFNAFSQLMEDLKNSSIKERWFPSYHSDDMEPEPAWRDDLNIDVSDH